MFTSQNLGLKVWNLTTDPYDHSQLADNWRKVDEHDHTPGRGLPITSAAIQDGAVIQSKIAPDVTLPTASIPNGSLIEPYYADGSVDARVLAPNSVTTSKILDGNVTTVKIGDGQVTLAKIETVTRNKIPPLQTYTDALPGTSGTPSSSNKYVTNADTRNTNARKQDGGVWTAPTLQHAANIHNTGNSDLNASYSFAFRTVKGLWGDEVQFRGHIQLASSQVPNGSNKDCVSGLPLTSGGDWVWFHCFGYGFPETCAIFLLKGNRSGGFLELSRIRNLQTGVDATTNADTFIFDGIGYAL